MNKTFQNISDTSPKTSETIRYETNYELKQFKNNKKLLNGDIENSECSIQSGIIMRGPRVCIPVKLRPAIL